VPVSIETGGVDSLVTFNFANYLMHWNDTGFAWVGFDVPGIGTSIGLRMTYDIEKVHLAVIEALQADDSIDNKNMFVTGRSLGGYAALRLLVTGKAEELDLAGIMAFCPIGEHIFSQSEAAIRAMDPMLRSTWAARSGIDPDDVQALTEYSEPFSFSYQGLWGKTLSSVPLLIYNSPGDFQNPVSEMKEMARLSENGTYIVAEPEYADDDGHCGCRTKALEIFGNFVNENMRQNMQASR
jgi:pimeloyl-ACP methyl ester carboxylesterase